MEDFSIEFTQELNRYIAISYPRRRELHDTLNII